jgi:hypothetical protein
MKRIKMKRDSVFRRKQKIRHNKRAGKIIARWNDPPSFNVLEEQSKAAEVHCVWCSEACCGNPRKYFGEKTLQERRADEAMKCE